MTEKVKALIVEQANSAPRRRPCLRRTPIRKENSSSPTDLAGASGRVPRGKGQSEAQANWVPTGLATVTGDAVFMHFGLWAPSVVSQFLDRSGLLPLPFRARFTAPCARFARRNSTTRD
jgi:hypothetical protein